MVHFTAGVGIIEFGYSPRYDDVGQRKRDSMLPLLPPWFPVYPLLGSLRFPGLIELELCELEPIWHVGSLWSPLSVAPVSSW